MITDEQVEIVGAALYKYWNDVNEECRKRYRERVRAALEKAFDEHPQPPQVLPPETS